jgi:hypothetical protein
MKFWEKIKFWKKEREEDGELEGTFEDFKKTIRDTLNDIVTLEVNSVLVSNISATHPSSDREYLCQTCDDLRTWFEKNKTDKAVQRPIDSESLECLKKLCEKLAPNETPIKCDNALYADVNECLEHESDCLNDVQCSNRSEYRRHLHYLRQYLELYNKFYAEKDEKKKFTSRDRQQLRKLWELVGATCIYAQTVLDLDGDIVSRINDQLFNKAGDNAEELMHFHSQNVEAGSNYRNGLMDTFVQIIRAITGKK